MLLFVFSTLVPPFFSGIIGCGSAYVILRINRAHAESTEQRKAREAAEAAGRQQVLDLVQQAKHLESALARQQLNHDKDLAYVTEILKEATQAQRQIVELLANVSHLGKGQQRLEEELVRVWETLADVNKHIIAFASRQHERTP